MSEHPVLTIGHSTHSLEAFLRLLVEHNIGVVADVRSAPYSRYNPQFNKDALSASLKEHGIKYVYLGKELGGRTFDSSYEEEFSRTALFQEGIARIVKGSAMYRIALMCAEKDPIECHRGFRIAPALVEEGIRVLHILSDGSLEPYEASIERLLRVSGLEEDMFHSRQELVAEALARKVASIEQKMSMRVPK